MLKNINVNGKGTNKKKITLLGKNLTKERMFNAYWLWDARQGRGSGYINELRLTSYIPVIGIIMLLFPGVPRTPIFLTGYVLFFFVLTYTLGYIDEKYVGYWQFDNERAKTYHVNPYERRIERYLLESLSYDRKLSGKEKERLNELGEDK